MMQFGITNASAAFPAIMKTIFIDLLDNRVIIYLDNILGYSKTYQKQTCLVKEIFGRLQAKGLYENVENNLWFSEEVELLSVQGTQLKDPKAQACVGWLLPRKVNALHAVLRFANFLCHFIPHHSVITRY